MSYRLFFLVFFAIVMLFFVGCDMSTPVGQQSDDPDFSTAKLTRIELNYGPVIANSGGRVSALAKASSTLCYDSLICRPDDAPVYFHIGDQDETAIHNPVFLGTWAERDSFTLNLPITVSSQRYIAFLTVDGIVEAGTFSLTLNGGEPVEMKNLEYGYAPAPSGIYYNVFYVKKVNGKVRIVQDESRDDRTRLFCYNYVYNGYSYLTDKCEPLGMNDDPPYPEMQTYWAKKAVPDDPITLKCNLSFGLPVPMYYNDRGPVPFWERAVIHFKVNPGDDNHYYAQFSSGFAPHIRLIGGWIMGPGYYYWDNNHFKELRHVVTISAGTGNDFNAGMYGIDGDGPNVREENRPQILGWGGSN